MTRGLRRKINVLITTLLTMIWISVLALYVQNEFHDNQRNLRDSFRQEFRSVGWTKFLESEGELSDLDDLEYAVFSVNKDKNAELLFQTFESKTAAELMPYANRLAKKWESSVQFKEYTYLYKTIERKKYHRYVVLISNRPAVKETMPTIYLCILLVIAGVAGFYFGARLLSGWMVHPIEEMIQSEKTFISNVSHELKTPLSIIQANSELLAQDVEPDNKHLGYIRQETEHMVTLINRMLTLVRLDASQIKETKTRFCVGEALLDVIYPMESVAYEKHIMIETDIPEDLYLHGVQDQIENVMSILLNNAISYTPKQGQIKVQAFIQDKKFNLVVWNTGSGIPAEQQAHLFDRFFRVDEARADNEHFGLGLSIAQSIVKNHAGRINYTRKDEYNVFTVILPA